MSDLKVFNQLFTDYQSRFVRFANAYVRDIDIAEDFTIDSLMYYWENRNTLPSDINIPAYILISIKHKCLNYLQHLQVRQEVNEKLKDIAEWELSTRIASLHACDPTELFTAEIQAIVRKTLEELPERTREIFKMSREENLTYKEIAEQMNITVKGVEFHISKAIKSLQSALQDYLPTLIILLHFISSAKKI